MVFLCLEKTNSTGKEAFPVLQSCGRWVVIRLAYVGVQPVAVVKHTDKAEWTCHSACCRVVARATSSYPYLTTGNSYEVVGPDGASVHIYPRDDLDFFRVSICLILLTKTVMAPE